MPVSNGLVLADDATGALECASLLAILQLDVSIALSETPRPMPAHGIRVADTESRHLTPESAAIRMRAWLAQNRTAQIFKKTDSTLRGNIAAELIAMLDRPIVYIPAYPALGRTVRDGILFVDDVPVAETAFAKDVRAPVRNSRVADLFPANLIMSIPDASGLAAALGSSSPRILICDAATDEDLTSIAAVLREATARPFVASSAGFVKAWAGLGSYPGRVPPAFPAARKWLVVCGSRHPQSRRQASIAEAMGLRVVQSGMDTMSSSELAASELARRALGFMRAEKPDAVLIMGGDTVFALWNAMGLTAVIPLPEPLPGIAACVSPDNTLLFVTKAGGFGDDRVVEQIQERFKSQ